LRLAWDSLAVFFVSSKGWPLAALVLGPMRIAEIAPPAGAAGGLFQFNVVLGILLACF
jgi:hypothetical protein